MSISNEGAGLAPAEDGEIILSVAQLNRQVGQLLETCFSRIWVRGEISNFTRAASGHWYFSIKDEAAAVRAVMFRGRTAAVGFVPQAGDRCEFRVQVSLYEPRGDFQVQVESLRRAGRGDLHEAFLRLKDKLTAEGLCDTGRKRPIAPMPLAIGVVTSLAAAALRDVLSVIARRAPHVRVVIYPSPVQGREAAGQLVAALNEAIARQEVDTLLLVRGGGSLEDLWSFNDEVLARTIAGSPIPVVSGVGHETDFTIADFVSDLRAPTPTAAAELCCDSRALSLDRLGSVLSRVATAQRRLLDRAAMRLDRATSMLVSPQQRLERQRQAVVGVIRRMDLSLQRDQAARGQRLHAAIRTLVALDPHSVVRRGYAIVRGSDGVVVKNALDLKIGERLDVELGCGRVQADVVQTDALL
ncbi:exodeoxyribonuclease VII large subunit [Alcaligenaceae bacterium CGII-47]|nr:exodeoxyribonuclease VII large subunit [Alcaligenaceae bacterium CGII-47]